MVGVSETRTLLLDLGERAIRTRGFAGFSYADLARDAGIRKASIHHHFPTKADLGQALIERYADNLASALEDIAQSAQSGGEAFHTAIALYRQTTEDGGAACLCAALATDTALLSETAQSALRSTNEASRQWFADVLMRGASDGSIALGFDADTQAAAVLAQLQGAQLLAKAAGSARAFDSAVATLEGAITG